MKLKLLTFLFLLIMIRMSSQSITLTFDGMTSGSEDILIENVTNGTSTSLVGENTITLNSGDVNDLGNNSKIKAYPNPFKDNVYIEFLSIKNKLLEVNITNEIGQIILHQIEIANCSNCKMQFIAPQKGIYFIKIKSRTSSKSFSVFCNKANNNIAKIIFEDIKPIIANYDKTIKGLTFIIGDVLKYTANNNDVLSIITDAPSSSKTYTFLYDCIDFENNAYSTAKVGNQWWMAENLKSKKYSNGTNISGTYVYNNSSSNEDVYGRLYTWEAMMNGADGNNNNPSGVNGVCPTSWHVPSELEWDEMRDALGGKIPMHGKVKETGMSHWLSPNDDATNESGMTILPGGLRWNSGEFQYIGSQAFFWNTTDDLSGSDILNASGYTFFSETSDYYMYTWNLKTIAQSIRCVKD